MACPDELSLDLWRAGALPAEEAAAVAAHTRGCQACQAAGAAAERLGVELAAALMLDAGERAYLSGLDLAAPWRAAPAAPAAAAAAWGWIALAGTVAGYLAWSAASSALGPAAGEIALVGLGAAPLELALAPLVEGGWALLELSSQPALGLAEPLLALIAIALLAWPRAALTQRSTS